MHGRKKKISAITEILLVKPKFIPDLEKTNLWFQDVYSNKSIHVLINQFESHLKFVEIVNLANNSQPKIPSKLELNLQKLMIL